MHDNKKMLVHILLKIFSSLSHVLGKVVVSDDSRLLGTLAGVCLGCDESEPSICSRNRRGQI